MILREIRDRLGFLVNVGLDYLTLTVRPEPYPVARRSGFGLLPRLVPFNGVLYVLDEPSIGLHQRDNDRLLQALKEMRDLGNTLIVVEHDEDTMLEADYIIDIGPGAGAHGGQIVAPARRKRSWTIPKSLTGQYLSRKKVHPCSFKTS